jgi:hypothetical protein
MQYIVEGIVFWMSGGSFERAAKTKQDDGSGGSKDSEKQRAQ